MSDSIRDELLGPDAPRPVASETPVAPAAPAAQATPRTTMRAAQCGGQNLAGVPREVTAKGKPLLVCPECGWIETFEFDQQLLARRRARVERIRGWRRLMRGALLLLFVVAAVVFFITRAMLT